jgi:hypothetical protein
MLMIGRWAFTVILIITVRLEGVVEFTISIS